MIKVPESLQRLVVKALKIFGFSTGSVLFVGSDGNISQDNANLFWDNVNKRFGIGRINPIERLHISPSSSSIGVRVSTVGGYAAYQTSDEVAMAWAFGQVQSDGRFGFWAGGGPGVDERFTILQNGNVGFGTPSPTAKVDVVGGTGYNQLRLRTSYTPTGTSDTNGNVGDIAWDDNYIYVKTSVGWKRAALSIF
jgi:hypothetical protein